ncbi:MAG: NUDIX hydrolase [Candidatus Kapaibacterium sp.]
MNSATYNFFEYLNERLKRDLPATTAHIEMAPKMGEKLYRGFTPSKSARKSAVMLGLFPKGDDFEIIFTLRSTKLGNHSGQISFPGGHAEPGENAVETALRETTEEVGIRPADIKIAGTLSDLFVPPSDNIITPVVGLLEREPVIRVNPAEVEEAFSMPVGRFRNGDYLEREMWMISGAEVEVPFWNVHTRIPLWGATAMILKEFLVVAEDFFD